MSFINKILESNCIFELEEEFDLENFENNIDLLKEENILKTPVDLGKGMTKVKISIYASEGVNVPHIHLHSPNMPNGDCCVKLFKCAQCPHNNHQTLLNSTQAKNLDKVLRLPYKNNKSITNWRRLVDLWILNVDNTVKVPDKQIDYKKVNDYVEPIGG